MKYEVGDKSRFAGAGHNTIVWITVRRSATHDAVG